MTELGKVNDSYKSAEWGDGHDIAVTEPERVDHGGDEDHVQSRHGDGRSGIRGSRQHLSFPVYERTNGRLLIEVDSVVGLTFSIIRVPYDLKQNKFHLIFLVYSLCQIVVAILISKCACRLRSAL